MISVKYSKQSSQNLTNISDKFNLENIQNYQPIFRNFFKMNTTNWNSFGLDSHYRIAEILNMRTYNVAECILESNSSENIAKDIFVKFTSTIDTNKYLIGAYSEQFIENMFVLPSFENHEDTKIHDVHNSCYVENLFAYLSGKVLHQYNFVNALDYYGSYVGIKNDFTINVIDDITYLCDCDYFVKNAGILYHADDDIMQFIHKKKPKLIITSEELHIDENGDIVDCVEATEIEEQNDDETPTAEVEPEQEAETEQEHLDICENESYKNIDDRDDILSIKTITTCTSHTSLTSNDSLICSDDESDDDTLNWSNIYSDCTNNEPPLLLSIPKLPSVVICTEKCHDTLDSLICRNQFSTMDEWFSMFSQIIFSLSLFQKLFEFTHNDLHTCNVVYTETDKHYLYYKINGKHYKIPTYGKIYKIIDFGRAIFTFNGKRYCSDSFKQGGDAYTQYNTEPFFDETKNRVDPNMGFDMCRLGCSVFEHIVDDIVDHFNKIEKNELELFIDMLCSDVNGKNIIYKHTGEERYPDFKLYKMIARYVHKHTPLAQLERPEFSKFIISNKNVLKHEQIINIDELPSYCN